MRVADTRIGDRTFLGNHALVPAGADWPDGLFVGVATPADARRAGRDSSWFGHPPMRLPRREVVEVDRRLTHAPDPLRRATRAFWETLRFLLPGLPAAVAALWYAAAFQAASSMRPLGFLAFALPALTALALLLPCLATLALKWLLLGRVKPGRHGFWSCWCGRWDFVYMAWTAWARGSLASLEGSLALNACLRLTGMRIGRLVLLGRGFAQVVDPDMLCFEDRATVEGQFQAHSFEDRVLKIDRLRIGAGATVGAQTVLFYGAEIGAGAKIAPQGVVMKHDRIAPGSRHAGTPIRPLD
ncbi:MAG: hypothetical protein H6648_05185 [Caldilineae bacterium]|nr:hypothetical protein [Caldilineae bacterium]